MEVIMQVITEVTMAVMEGTEAMDGATEPVKFRSRVIAFGECVGIGCDFSPFEIKATLL